MIATLLGEVSEQHANRIVLEVGGVGYEVITTSLDAALARLGQKIKLFIYENIREDSHDLFGFSSIETKHLFTQLLSVKNVGPKVAVAILEIGTPDEVRASIANGNVKFLQTAKGVGKRAAEQIVVELRDKVGEHVSEGAERIVSRVGISTQDEAVQALLALGFTESDAVAALSHVDSSLSVEERVRLSLAHRD